MLFLVSVCQLDVIKSILTGRLNRVMYLFLNRSNEFKLSSTLLATSTAAAAILKGLHIERSLHFERLLLGAAAVCYSLQTRPTEG